jgi:hypothetical protein
VVCGRIYGLNEAVVLDNLPVLLVFSVMAGGGSTGLTRVLIVIIGIQTLDHLVICRRHSVRVECRCAP